MHYSFFCYYYCDMVFVVVVVVVDVLFVLLSLLPSSFPTDGRSVARTDDGDEKTTQTLTHSNPCSAQFKVSSSSKNNFGGQKETTPNSGIVEN